MNESFETFTCASCGRGEVKPMPGHGRRMLYRNFPSLPIPDEVAVPTCDHCGEEWLDDEALASLDASLKEAARKARSGIAAQSIGILAESAHQRDLEALLDLSFGYLSKVKHGQEVPGAPLTALLALLAARPARLRELEHLWSSGRVALRSLPSGTSFTGLDAVPDEVPELAEAC